MACIFKPECCHADCIIMSGHIEGFSALTHWGQDKMDAIS